MNSHCHINDQIQFVTMTPDGPVRGAGKVAAIYPAGKSHWLHVLQESGTVRMMFEATTKIEVMAAA